MVHYIEEKLKRDGNSSICEILLISVGVKFSTAFFVKILDDFCFYTVCDIQLFKMKFFSHLYSEINYSYNK